MRRFLEKHTSANPICVKIGTIVYFDEKKSHTKQVRLAMVPPLRFKTIILIQITKINLKNINGLKENGKKQSKSLSNVTKCNVFFTKKGQNGQNQIFPGTFTCFLQSNPNAV